MRAQWIFLVKMRKYARRIRNTSSGQATGFSFTIARNNPHYEILLLRWAQHLLNNLVQVKAADLLPLWEILKARQELRCKSLCRYEQEYVLDLPLPVQFGVFPGPLEWVGFDIDNQRNAEGGEFPLPHFERTVVLA